MEELSKTKYTLKYVPAIFDFIKEKSLPKEDETLDDDEYAFKVASLMRISPHPIFLIVSNSEKDTLQKKAKKLGYSIQIISYSDFE